MSTFRRLLVKLPLYNKIRSLKHKLVTAQNKLWKKTLDLKKIKKSLNKKGKKAPTGLKLVTHLRPLPTLSQKEYPEVAKDMSAFKTLVEHIAEAPKKVRLSLLQKKENVKSRRVASHIASKIGVNRKSILGTRKKCSMRRTEYAKEKAMVIRFLKKPGNSNPLPGKHDTSSKGIQKYTLSDTMSNLHQKFRVEHPNSTMSLATFCRQRPLYMKTILWADRRQCLCVQHQNGILKLKAIHNNMSVSRFLDANSEDDITNMLQSLPDKNISYREWQKEDVPYQGTTIKKLRLKHLELSKVEFCDQFQQQFADLRQHVFRMRKQFTEIEHLKNSLETQTEATCQLDYSENYACKFQDEPAQAFYDRRQVTVHPMVIHYRQNDESLNHKSFVGISSDRSHSAPTTFAFLRKLVPEVLKIIPHLTKIHYISDSPVSQYRNKSIAKIVSHHEEYFQGIQATWDFLESGHGKGPCDGVGGSIKRSADVAVKHGSIISNAEEFFAWAQTYSSTISCIYVTTQEISYAERMLKNATPCKGLGKCHSIRPYNGSIWISETSCYQDCCARTLSCQSWTDTQVKVFTNQPEEDVHDTHQDEVEYTVGTIVDVTYGNKVYRGQIIEYDGGNHDYNVKFMKRNKDGNYFWPKSNTWSAWVLPADIVNVIE